MTENVKSENGRVKQKYHVTTDYAWCTLRSIQFFTQMYKNSDIKIYIFGNNIYFLCIQG